MATTEERLAALEAKLAALTATTPTEYYTHQYSGEEIDAAVGRAVSGGALDTSVTNVSNQLGTFVRPNLLDNWYFGRPVNQRGKTEYAGDGYTIDRWKHGNTNTTKLLITDESVVVSVIANLTSSSKRTLHQIVDNVKQFIGKVLTVSFLVDDVKGSEFSVGWRAVVGSQVQTKYISVNAPGMYSVTFNVPNDTTELLANVISEGATVIDDYVSIKAAKLELGSTQTLAHREGDKWVLNEVPDYGEQLRRCLRHDYILGIDGQNCPIGIGTAYSNDGVLCDIQLPEYLRANPAVSLSGGGIHIRFSAAQNLVATSVLNYGFSGDKVQLYFPGLSGLTPSQSCDLYTETNSKLEFNSNL